VRPNTDLLGLHAIFRNSRSAPPPGIPDYVKVQREIPAPSMPVGASYRRATLADAAEMLKDRSTVEERGRRRSVIFHSSLYNTKWGNAIMKMTRFAWPLNGHRGRLCAAVVAAALPMWSM
jgi:hypothetical protein